jgi:hypothetical protein
VSPENETIVDKYKKALRGLQFAEIAMLDAKGEYVHHYKTRINSDTFLGTSAKVRRLIQELGSLRYS